MDLPELFLERPEVRSLRRKLELPDPISEFEDFLLECQRLDPRKGEKEQLVRFQLEKDTTQWPIETTDSVMIMASHCRMIKGETPLEKKRYDLLLALGGANEAPLNRTAAAANMIKSGRIPNCLIVVAGSTRPLNADEMKRVSWFAPGAETEYELCRNARDYVSERSQGIKVVSFCREDPHSGNDGVIDEIMHRIAEEQLFTDPLTVGAVTTQIYLQGLEFDMMRAAKRHGWREFGVAGHPTDPRTEFSRTTATYLSECLTTLQKAARAAAAGC